MSIPSRPEGCARLLAPSGDTPTPTIVLVAVIRGTHRV